MILSDTWLTLGFSGFDGRDIDETMATRPADSDPEEVTLYAHDSLATVIWLIVVDVCPSGTWPNIPDALSKSDIRTSSRLSFVYVASY
jgi:hypothetical protein